MEYSITKKISTNYPFDYHIIGMFEDKKINYTILQEKVL